MRTRVLMLLFVLMSAAGAGARSYSVEEVPNVHVADLHNAPAAYTHRMVPSTPNPPANRGSSAATAISRSPTGADASHRRENLLCCSIYNI